jgi:DNA primase
MWQHEFSEDDRKKIVMAGKNSLFKDEGRLALDYLLKTRKFNKHSIDAFDVGYCPLHAPHQLRGRIITPIHDYSGNIISISTRHLDEDHPMRFWHEAFAKRFHVYGLHLSKKIILQKNKVVIVEGEFDALALHSVGIRNVIALCSKNLSLSQVGVLSRYTNNFILLLDEDPAGIKGVQSAKELWEINFLKEKGLNLYVASLPLKDDPNDFLKKHDVKELQKILIASQEEDF